MEYRNDFWHKIKMYHFDPYNVLLAITTNTLMTAFVLQGHIYPRHDTEVICNLNRLNALFRLVRTYSMFSPCNDLQD